LYDFLPLFSLALNIYSASSIKGSLQMNIYWVWVKIREGRNTSPRNEKVMSIESKKGRREEKRKKRRFITWKSLFSSCCSIITPVPLLFKDELESSS
jgi:hypothetical protein